MLPVRRLCRVGVTECSLDVEATEGGRVPEYRICARVEGQTRSFDVNRLYVGEMECYRVEHWRMGAAVVEVLADNLERVLRVDEEGESAAME